ncbi:MAG: hypothetical protein HYT93_03945 [Parcubacteria group bacterium]|nr:hypothetical protein [Parcubacteria group bacterium]
MTTTIRKLLIAAGTLILVVVAGFSLPLVTAWHFGEPVNAPALKAPQVDNCPMYFCRKLYTVTQATKKLEGTGFGWTIIEEPGSGHLFTVLVTPYQNYNIGAVVQVREVIYRQNNMSLARFLVAYDPEDFSFRPYAPQGQP